MAWAPAGGSGTAIKLHLHFNVFDQIPEAGLISLIYRQRWQIELYFKWIKMILNGRHWLAESPAGVQTRFTVCSSPPCC